MRYTKIIIIKDIIPLEKSEKKRKLSKDIVDTTAITNVVKQQVLLILPKNIYEQ